MSDPIPDMLYKQQEAQAKYVYFLLAAAGSCVAFAIHITNGATLEKSLMAAGGAVLLWSVSVFAGLRNRRLSMSYSNLNVGLIQAERYLAAAPGNEKMAIAVATTRTLMKDTTESGSFWFDFQLWTFYLGSLAFVGWHVWQIVENPIVAVAK